MEKLKKAQILCVALVFWAPSADTKRKLADQQVPNLTLQWEASQPTGQLQISLVFKKDRVDIFANTSLWQKASSPRLGHLTSGLSEKWQLERERLNVYLSLLKTSNSLSKGKFPEGIEELLMESPHASVVRLNGFEQRREDSYFSALEGVFPVIWKNQWSCIDCVIYKLHPQGIERQRLFKSGHTYKTDKTVFSREQMKCYSINQKFLECTDTHGGPTGNGWGSFRIRL